MKLNTPILITGIHRSATTWIGKLFNTANSTVYVNEPFNPSGWSYGLNGLADKYYIYYKDTDVNLLHDSIDQIMRNNAPSVYSKKMLERWFPYKRKGRKIFKDPIAAMSSEWLYKEFNMHVLITIKHPVAYVQSLKRLNWEFPFDHLLEQDHLMNDHLHVFKNEMMNVNNDFISRAALSWKCIYYVLSKFIERNNWCYVRHEDISLNPMEEFKKLFEIYNLQWSKKVENKIIKSTTSRNVVKPKNNEVHNMQRDSKALAYSWKDTIGREEIEHIYKITNKVSHRYYTEDDWKIK